MSKIISFEDKLRRIKAIQEQLQNPELTIDKSILLFEEGQQLLKSCFDYLSDAQLKIEQLD